MIKNKLFIILSMAVVLVLFITAASCNMCGISITPDTSSTDEDEDEAEESKESGEKETAEEEEGSSGTNSISTNPEETGDSNQQNAGETGSSEEPEITIVIYNDDDITDLIGNEEIEIDIADDETHHFIIIAEDTDSDELEFDVEASEGETTGLNKTGVKSAEFNYQPQTTFSGVFEMPHTAAITVEAEDPDGNTDTLVIDLNITMHISGSAFIGLETLQVVDNETGSIVIYGDEGDGAYTNYIYVGDSSDGGSSSGYISFNISSLAGKEVESATLSASSCEEVGDNRSFLGILRIGTIDYGTGALTVSDSTISANLIAQLPNSTTNISYSNDALANALQSGIDASRNRLQLKIYWSHPGSDDDGEADGLRYRKENVSLNVGVRQ